MKATLTALVLLVGMAITSCQETTKTDNETMDNDTMVLKSDTAVAHPK